MCDNAQTTDSEIANLKLMRDILFGCTPTIFSLTTIKLNAQKILAVVLIVGGLGYLYGEFSYAKQSHDVKLGSLELSVNENQTVNVPVWLGVGAIAVVGLLLVLGSRKE